MAFGHGNIKIRVSAHKKGAFMGTISFFYSVCPKEVYIRFCYRFIGELLGINVDFYELVPNMVIMDKWKKIFASIRHADRHVSLRLLTVAAFAVYI